MRSEILTMNGTPDPTDAEWQTHYSHDSWPPPGAGGLRMPATTPQPAADPNEPWCELTPIRKVSPAAAFELIEELRAAGIPVLGPKPRRSGLFSGGKVDVTLSVPERWRLRAESIVAARFGPGNMG
jgi:hypothetical protein